MYITLYCESRYYKLLILRVVKINEMDLPIPNINNNFNKIKLKIKNFKNQKAL